MATDPTPPTWQQPKLLPPAQVWLKMSWYLDGASGIYQANAWAEDFWDGEQLWCEVGHEHPLALVRTAGPRQCGKMLERALTDLPPF
jgi:hypothetical protein